MKTLKSLVMATVAAAALASFASAANAAVFISFDGTNTVAGGAFANGVFTFNATCGAICGGFDAIQVSGDTGTLPTLMHTQSVDATTSAGAAADVTVWVTRNNITSPDYHNFFSAFTSNNSFNANFVTPFTVTLTNYVDASNGLFGGVFVSSFSSSAAGSASLNVFGAPGNTGGGLYSVTEKYVIHADAFGGAASSSPSIVFAGGAVPEPATWGLMILGFGGVGGLIRNRRRQTVSFA